MKFKVGDKVRVREDLEVDKYYNFYFAEEMAKLKGKVVEIEDVLWDLEGYFYSIKELDAYIWTSEMFSGLAEEPIAEKPKNLIPLIAKELGVEIGERFKVNNVSGTFYFENYYLLEEGLNYFIFDNESTRLNAILTELINGHWKIEKLPKKPILTEDEKAILRNLPEKYRYIARDNSGLLYIYENKPKKDGNVWSNYNYNCLDLFQHLFQFINFEDEEPYNIKELLKE